MSDFDLKPTNTLAMASLDALKNEGLEDPKINSNISKLATLDLDESYMIKTINFINESNREFTDSKITLYKALSESAGEQGVILESFSDFFSKVKDIIDAITPTPPPTDVNLIILAKAVKRRKKW